MFYFISSFPFLFAFDVGGLGFDFCVFVAGWRMLFGVSGLLLLIDHHCKTVVKTEIKTEIKTVM